MRQQRNAIDGFVPRRPGSQLGELHGRPTQKKPEASPLRSAPPQRRAVESAAAPRPQPIGIAKSDLDESLRGIDDTAQEEPKKKRGIFGRRRNKKPLTKKQKIIRWTIAVIVAIILGVGGFLVYKAMTASDSIFKGNIFGLIQNKPLKEDENGRSNILILGTSEDDPGHGGAYLTDSMMVMSIRQKNHTIDMFSIPRDLYVQYGMACNSGYQGKINEYFNCVNSDWKSKEAEEQRLTETRKFVGEIFGMDIQYAVHVNNTVIKEAVDAVGGVDVDIQGSNGDPGILDRNFDWRCNYKCYLVKYDNGVHHLDGKHALFLAMARGDIAPTYGLGNSNFDREKNQQKIIIALKEKAVSTGTLTNIGKVTGLIDALGHNLRTNFETSEIRTLMDIASKTESKNIKSISLFDDDNRVVTTGNYGGASVVMPAAGIFNYTDIRAFLAKKFSANPVTREGAKIVVLNGSGQTGVAQTEADKLTKAGFIVDDVANAPAGKYADVEIYQVGKGMDATKAKLQTMFNVEVMTKKPPLAVTSDTNFVIVFGKARTAPAN